MTTTDGIILVTGATGQQGGATAARLLADGWHVRALTRDTTSTAARTLAAAGAEVVPGDMGDRASLDAAAHGVQGVFSVQPTPGMPGVPAAYSLADEVRHGRNVADAAQAAGARQLVYASAFGADQSSGLSTLDSKREIEEHLRTLAVDTTVLRPTSFMENLVHPVWGLRDGALVTPYLPDTRQQSIALDDIAAFASLAFRHPARLGPDAHDLAGDTLTPPQTAAAISRATGREVPYVQIPIETVRAQNEKAARGIQSLIDGLYTPVDTGPLRVLHPDLLTFDAWLARTGAAQLGTLLDDAQHTGPTVS